jgi:hypothetical protein
MLPGIGRPDVGFVTVNGVVGCTLCSFDSFDVPLEDLVSFADLGDDVIEAKLSRLLFVRDDGCNRITTGYRKVATGDDVIDGLDPIDMAKGRCCRAQAGRFSMRSIRPIGRD